MQQASTGKASNDSESGGSSMPQSSVRNRFVINLCGSTTPVSLTPPDHAGLKRFTFFVSRRREDGRERFRLHMGYFESQEDAERLLDIVREIYPGAWAGLAPGQRLRAKAEADALAAADNAASTDPQRVTASALVSAAAAVAVPAPVPAPVVPTAVVAAPVVAAPVVAAAVVPAAVVAASVEVPASPVEPPPLSLMPDPGRRVLELAAITQENDAAARALSNVRAAIASLDDSTTSTPTLSPIPELKPAVVAKAPAAIHPASDLSATGTLRVLESAADTASESTVRQPALPTTDDAAAAAAKAGASGKPRDEKTAYAVQLLWSVQPIDIGQIPQLAIFSAYTLYGAEGNRDGRRWYGVRLGFFTDAVSAKQVAHYVRSDFSTVSVVPVTVRERERAKLAATRPDATPVTAAATASTAAPTAATASTAAPSAGLPPVSATAKPTAATGFEFIEDNKLQAAGRALGNAQAARGARVAPGKRAKLRPGRAAMAARAKPKTMTLEETLEILGAGELKMDDGRRPLINNDGRGAAAETSKNKPSRFGRLLERLSERLGS
jgi:hypothetical protein